jgi:hypothetical protein
VLAAINEQHDLIQLQRPDQHGTAGTTLAGLRSPDPARRGTGPSLDAFGPQRSQDNHREVCSATSLALDGSIDSLWSDRRHRLGSVATPTARSQVENVERGVDIAALGPGGRCRLATTPASLGTPGAIVCRAQLLAAPKARTTAATPTAAFAATTSVSDMTGYGPTICATPTEGLAAVNQCQPLNVFGARATRAKRRWTTSTRNIAMSHTNEQEQLLGAISGQLWDSLGRWSKSASPSAASTAASTRSAVGRSATTGDRLAVAEHRRRLPGRRNTRVRRTLRRTLDPAVPRQLAGRLRRAERFLPLRRLLDRRRAPTCTASTWSTVRSRTLPSRPASTPPSGCRTWRRTSRPCRRPSSTRLVDPCATRQHHWRRLDTEIRGQPDQQLHRPGRC